jgi:exodeoxyribonuclease V alpha subunit
MEDLAGGVNRSLFIAAALASRAVSEGHICVNLADYAGTLLSFDHEAARNEPAPALTEWVSLLAASPVVAAQGEERPLVLSGSLLYLYRYWNYENRLAQQLLHRCAGIAADFNTVQAGELMTQLFGAGRDGADWQKIAAAVALLKHFCLISGGPGTGKTSTVIRIAALLAALHADSPFTILLAAPTGKAATRLEESINALLPGLHCSPEIASGIPKTASTVHSLLKPIPDSPYFRHDADHPLMCDAILVDEASMIDLALMTKLFEAVPLDARIILIGDRNQLASVEAGALLTDLDSGDSSGFSPDLTASIQKIMPEFEGPGTSAAPLADCIVTLRKAWRFDTRSGIGEASRSINSGDFNAVRSILADPAFPDCEWYIPHSQADFLARLRTMVIPRLRDCFASADPRTVLSLHAGFRILCALRSGPFGVTGINARVEKMLALEGLVPASGSFYPGKPILVTRNDYQVNLFNGDMGIIMPDREDGGVLKAFFPDGGAHVKALPLTRLPPHETAYAMTVHKAQGSEFDETLLILPPHPSPLVTRELLYTGITRARRRCTLWCSEETLRSAVATRLERTSGLREKLWKYW